MNHWADCENIYIKHYSGGWTESELIYKGFIFNLFTIEQAMWEDYAYEYGFPEQPIPDDPYKYPKFKEYLQNHAETYLDDLLGVALNDN